MACRDASFSSHFRSGLMSETAVATLGPGGNRHKDKRLTIKDGGFGLWWIKSVCDLGNIKSDC